MPTVDADIATWSPIKLKMVQSICTILFLYNEKYVDQFAAALCLM